MSESKKSPELDPDDATEVVDREALLKRLREAKPEEDEKDEE